MSSCSASICCFRYVSMQAFGFSSTALGSRYVAPGMACEMLQFEEAAMKFAVGNTAHVGFFDLHMHACLMQLRDQSRSFLRVVGSIAPHCHKPTYGIRCSSHGTGPSILYRCLEIVVRLLLGYSRNPVSVFSVRFFSGICTSRYSYEIVC